MPVRGLREKALEIMSQAAARSHNAEREVASQHKGIPEARETPGPGAVRGLRPLRAASGVEPWARLAGQGTGDSSVPPEVLSGPAELGLWVSSGHLALRMCHFRHPQLGSWVEATWVKHICDVEEIAREAFPGATLKLAISSLPPEANQYFQYKHTHLFIKTAPRRLRPAHTESTCISKTQQFIF